MPALRWVLPQQRRLPLHTGPDRSWRVLSRFEHLHSECSRGEAFSMLQTLPSKETLRFFETFGDFLRVLSGSSQHARRAVSMWASSATPGCELSQQSRWKAYANVNVSWRSMPCATVTCLNDLRVSRAVMHFLSFWFSAALHEYVRAMVL